MFLNKYTSAAKISALCVTTLLGISAPANAVTVNTNFDFLAAQAYAAPGTAMTFDSNGVRVSVTAFTYTNSPFTLSANPIGVIVGNTGANGGLGACTDGDATSCGGEPHLNGSPLHELLKFTFTKVIGGALLDVDLNSVVFGNTNANEEFDLFYGNPLTQWADNQTAIHSGQPVQTPVTTPISNMFGIGIDNGDTSPPNTDQVRILNFNITHECQVNCDNNQNPPPVPLPAGGVLLLTGLAGLGAAARRRKRK